MDPRQQPQEYSGSNAQHAGSSYNFNSVQNDPFSTFVNTDNDSAFESSWTNQTLPIHQQQINGFDQGNQNWQQTSYQSSSFLDAPSYGNPRDYEQQYSRSPASFNYQNFDNGRNQSLGTNNYEIPSNTYADPLYAQLRNNSHFDYSAPTGLQQHHATISPQALQTYPFNQSAADDSQHTHQAHYGPNLPVPRPSTTSAGLPTGPDWVSLAKATSASISARGLHIKPTAGLSSATKSTRIDGFVFVGNSKQTSAPIKVKIGRNDRKRSLKAIRRIFETEKGNEALSQERGHLMKKLKLTESKLGSRPAKSTAHSRSGSAAESESPSESSDSESDDDSAYYTESDVEIQPEEPSPVPPSRPVDPNKAVEYDVVKAVWAKKSVGLSSIVIRTALGEYWNIFKGIRDKWKTKATTLQQAIDKKDQANIKAYERRVVDQRRLLESCVELTLKHGHPDIIEKLGENPAFLLVFYQFFADRFKDSEYASGLINSVLELMVRCVTIDQEMLEKTKFDKVLPRLLKRGDDQGKVLAQKILDNAAEISQQKTNTGKAGQRPQSNGDSPKISGDTKVLKHDQVDDSKKVSSVSSKGLTANKTNKSSSALDHRQSPIKAEVKSAAKTTGSDASTVKVKTNHVTAKPTGFFAGLKSASKKPGTSAKAEEGKVQNAEPKAESAPAPPKSGFSFAATMAALETQKEAPPVKAPETRKPETPEEKKKRLRKEERSKLRVSFKADDDLVQIREFVHDPEEEMGHEDSQVRDVKDTRGEGQMLKMHKDLDLEEDEDYEPPDEIVLPEWTNPQPIDFSVIDDQELARNYTSRGGNVEIKSEEKLLQEQREAVTLMAVYTNDFDIPRTPREPKDTFPDEPVNEESFGAPTELTKSRESDLNARRNPANATPPMPDIANLLRIMQGQNQTQAQPQQPPPPPPPPPPPLQQPPQPAAAPTSLEAIFAQFNNPNPQHAPPMQQSSQQPSSGFDLQAALAGMQPTLQQQPGYAQQPPQPQVNIQAILAQMGTQPGSQTSQLPGYGYNNQMQIVNDRKRPYDQDGNDYGQKRARSGPGSDNLPYKVKVCKYWKDGKCRWGDNCSYLHEE
ncbi:hypothetical protein ACLMJK_000472 [Lecanora helva]